MTVFYQTLDTLFAKYLQSIGEMQGILEQEKKDLGVRDTRALERTIKAKESLAESINGLTDAQQKLFRTHNLPTGRESLERLLATLPNDPPTDALRSKWSEIKRLTAQCNEINAANGAYVALLRQHVQRSLDVLHGQSRAEFVYGRDGSPHRPAASRRLLSV
jgi:flagellar biosynthesis/type III secretory pathway chaperone